MEHGIVTSVSYEDGVVYCNVRAPRTTGEIPEVPVLKPHSGFIQVPSQGDTVAIDRLSDGKAFITNLVSRVDENPDGMKEGELAIQLDKGSRLAFKRKGNGDYDVHIESSGDVLINGVSFSEHTHKHEDSTTESTSEKETTEPVEFNG